MVERLKDDARVDWRQNGLSISQRALSRSGVPLLCLTLSTSVCSVACRMGGAGGLTSRMRPRRDKGRRAGWRAQPRARD